jgi:hypothetical protein
MQVNTRFENQLVTLLAILTFDARGGGVSCVQGTRLDSGAFAVARGPAPLELQDLYPEIGSRAVPVLHPTVCCSIAEQRLGRSPAGLDLGVVAEVIPTEDGLQFMSIQTAVVV